MPNDKCRKKHGLRPLSTHRIRYSDFVIPLTFVGIRHYPNFIAGKESASEFGCGQSKRTIYALPLVAVIADGFDRAPFLGLFALRFLFR
jgi:hypothetical protein